MVVIADKEYEQLQLRSRELESAIEELNKYHKRLEDMMKARTAELATANAQLRREIDERRQAEESHRRSEERFRSMVETTSDWLWEVDVDCVYTYASPKVKDILGYEPYEVIGKTPFDLMPPEEATRVKALFGPIAAAHQPFFRIENINRHKNGGMVVLETSGVPVFDDSGRFAGYHGIDRDITEQKRRELEYKTLLRTALDGFWIADLEGRFIDVNDAYCRLIGYNCEELLAMRIADVEAAETQEDIARHIRLITERGWDRFETRHRRKDGTMIDIEVSVNYAKVNGGLLFTYLRDISDRKKAENALRESERKYHSLFDNMMNGFALHEILFDEKNRPVDFVYLEVNNAFEKQAGLKRENVINRKVTEVFPDIKEDPYDWIGEYGKMAMGGKELRMEHYIKRLDRWLSVLSYSPKKGYVASVFEDITERKKAQMRLKESYEKLQRLTDGIIGTIAMIVETRDPYTAGHQRRSTQLAGAIAREMGLSEEQTESLCVAASIYDIGKIYVPAEILSKPGTLTRTEYNIIKIHPQASYEILKMIDFPWPIAKIAQQHQERYNGSGYPAGLSGESVLLEARILAVADTVEAMMSHRPYRSSKSIDAALDELTRNKGVLYDPRVVDACVTLFRERKFSFNVAATKKTVPVLSTAK